MDRIIFFLTGYVVLIVDGEQTDRFLNLCRSRSISLFGISFGDGGKLRLKLSLKNFFLLRPLRSKTRVHITVLEKHGLPFFFYRNKKRKAFFVGLFLCAGLLFLLSGRIWNIHIEGNVQSSTPEILEFLKEHQIVHGIKKSNINCAGLAALLRKQYPEITWVSAKISGTRLLLTLQEGKHLSVNEQGQTEQIPCNLISGVGGTIVKMVTRSGVPRVKVGDLCKKGDLLVEGLLPIKNDAQEVIRYEAVPADADIYICHPGVYKDEFLLKHGTIIFDERKKYSFYMKIGAWYLGGGKKKKDACSVTCEYPLRITENFVLPVFFGKTSSWRFQKRTEIYTKKQAEALALQRLHLYEEKLIRKGVQISENNVKIKINHTACIISGTLQLIEKAGEKAPVTQYEQPKERTATDG